VDRDAAARDAALRGDLEAAGLTLEEILTDPDDLFAISLSEPGA
jgi:hypothetical protein